jgi:carbon-monoxide dehydrogenase medium subunit
VKAIDELGGIEVDGGVGVERAGGGGVGGGVGVGGELRIGASTTHRQIERSALIRERWPSLATMARGVANLRVRTVGTIGGNLCFADPHSDPATFLIAADGSVSARRGGGATRRIAIEELIRGPYETALEDGELLLGVHLPGAAPGSALVHRKMSFHERPAITVAANVTVRAGSVLAARVAVGSVGVKPARVRQAEALLAEIDASAPSDGQLRAVAGAAGQEVQPVADANGSVEYKRQLVRVLTERCVRQALVDAAQ